MTPRVCAIVVTFHPDLTELQETVNALVQTVDGIVIVDNSANKDVAEWLVTNNSQICLLVDGLGENIGIATAHNMGIEWAKVHGYTHVLLMDQDSVPENDMVEQLLFAESHLLSRGEKVSVLGPRFIDVRYPDPTAFIRTQGWRIKRTICLSGQLNEYHRADYLISSGMLIRIPVLEQLGGMDEGLFIDYVDIEWGLRAKSHGYSCFGVCSAEMRHRLGDKTVPSYIGKSRRVPVRSPLRHYYMFRNAIHLYKRSYVPLAWIVNDAYRLVLKYIFYSTITAPRLKHLMMMSLGIWHGIIGRTGRYIWH